MATINSYSVSSLTAFNAFRSAIDKITTQCISAGYTLVESRLAVNAHEWSVLYKPNSLGTSSLSYYVALACQSATTNFFGTMFLDWNTSSKMATSYPSSGSITTTASGTASNSASLLPGSGTSMFAMSFGSTRNSDSLAATYMQVYLKGESVFVFYFNRGDTPSGTSNPGWLKYFQFGWGLFDSLLSPSDDKFPVMFGGLHAQMDQNTNTFGGVLTNYSTRAGCVMVDPIVLSSAFRARTYGVSAAPSPYITNVARTWAIATPKDNFINRYGLSRVPVHCNTGGSLSDNPEGDLPPRGLMRDFFISTAASGQLLPLDTVRWSYSGNSYSGTVLSQYVLTNESTGQIIGLD